MIRPRMTDVDPRHRPAGAEPRPRVSLVARRDPTGPGPGTPARRDSATCVLKIRAADRGGLIGDVGDALAVGDPGIEIVRLLARTRDSARHGLRMGLIRAVLNVPRRSVSSLPRMAEEIRSALTG